jgi:6,7-dimethyl-8-ribityllumazine synthase
MSSTDTSGGALKGISAELLGAGAGAGLRVGVVHTQWNAPVIDALVAGVLRELQARGVARGDIHVEAVPGAYELPLAARLMLRGAQAGSLGRDAAGARRELDAVVCVGCLIKGETMHFEYICEGVTQGVMRLNADLETPVIFGVLAVLNEEQAKARAGLLPGSHNHGEEWAQTAIKMALLRRRLLNVA